MESRAPKHREARIVPAVDRAARILALIEFRAKPMSITELAEELDASKGAVHEILRGSLPDQCQNIRRPQ